MSKKAVEIEKGCLKETGNGCYFIKFGKEKIQVDFKNLGGYEELESLRAIKWNDSFDLGFYVQFKDIYTKNAIGVYEDSRKVHECKPALDVLRKRRRGIMDSFDHWITKYKRAFEVLDPIKQKAVKLIEKKDYDNPELQIWTEDAVNYDLRDFLIKAGKLLEAIRILG